MLQRLFQRFVGDPNERNYKMSVKRTGCFSPQSDNLFTIGNGLLSNPTSIGVMASGNDADGRCIAHTSAGGGANQCGIISPFFTITRTGWNPVFTATFKLAQVVTQRFWVGLVSASPLGNDSLIGVAQSVGIRASTTAAITNFVAYSSSAAAENISNFAVAVPADVAVHTVTITVKNAGAGVTIQLDNQMVSFLANLPAIVTDLGFCVAVQEQAIVAKVIRLYGGNFEADR